MCGCFYILQEYEEFHSAQGLPSFLCVMSMSCKVSGRKHAKVLSTLILIRLKNSELGFSKSLYRAAPNDRHQLYIGYQVT